MFKISCQGEITAHPLELAIYGLQIRCCPVEPIGKYKKVGDLFEKDKRGLIREKKCLNACVVCYESLICLLIYQMIDKMKIKSMEEAEELGEKRGLDVAENYA